MKQQKPDFGVMMAAVDWGRSLVMIADDDAAARPWLRVLELAGVPVARIRDGRYAFSFAGRPDLTEAAPSAAHVRFEAAPELGRALLLFTSATRCHYDWHSVEYEGILEAGLTALRAAGIDPDKVWPAEAQP